MLKKRCIALMAIIVLLAGLSACKDTRSDKEIFLENYQEHHKDSSYDSFDNWYSIEEEIIETNINSVTIKNNKFIGYLDFEVDNNVLNIFAREFELKEEAIVIDTHMDVHDSKTIVSTYLKDKKIYKSEEIFEYRPDKEKKTTRGNDNFSEDIYLICDKLPNDFYNPLKYLNSYPKENIAFSKELRNVTLYSFFNNKIFSELDSKMNEVNTFYDEDIKIDLLYDSEYNLYSINYLNFKRSDINERFKFLSSYTKMEFKLANEKEITVPEEYKYKYQAEGKIHFVNL